MARRPRDIGSTFERKIAAKILKAAGSAFGGKDCYRTPQSGGHRFAGKGDHQISEKLAEIFPFCTECKRRKWVKLEKVFGLPKEFTGYLDQCLAATAKMPGRHPLVIMRAAGTQTFAISTSEGWFASNYGKINKDKIPGLVFHYSGHLWKLVVFDEVLDVLKKQARKKASKKEPSCELK